MDRNWRQSWPLAVSQSLPLTRPMPSNHTAGWIDWADCQLAHKESVCQDVTSKGLALAISSQIGNLLNAHSTRLLERFKRRKDLRRRQDFYFVFSVCRDNNKGLNRWRHVRVMKWSVTIIICEGSSLYVWTCDMSILYLDLYNQGPLLRSLW